MHFDLITFFHCQYEATYVTKFYDYWTTTTKLLHSRPINGKKPDERVGSLKFEINIHNGNIDRKTVSLFIPIFNIRSDRDILKLLVLLKKTPRDHKLSTGPHMYDIPNNLFIVQYLSF